MLNIGPQELLLILLVALIVVGPKRLPELSRSIGKGLREFRKAQDEVRKTINLGLDDSEPTSSPRAAGAPSRAGTAATDTPQEPTTSKPESDTENVARTLGRGLAEIRRTRQEIQRTFRVDLSDRPNPPRRGSAPSRAAPQPSNAPPAAPDTPPERQAAGEPLPAEPPREGAGEDAPASSPRPAE